MAARLICEVGFGSPVVLDARGAIVQGAVRVLAAERLGIAQIPVRVLGEPGVGPLRRRRTGDRRSGTLGLVGHSVWRPAVFSRHDVSWLACRAWRASTRRADVALLRALKRGASAEVVEGAAGEVALLARRLLGSLPGWSVTAVPCGNSGTGECFGKRLARAAAGALGLPFVQLFEDRPVEGGSSHPRRSAALAPLEWRERPGGPVLVVDDVATSGAHVEQAAEALRGAGVACAAVVWISGDVR